MDSHDYISGQNNGFIIGMVSGIKIENDCAKNELDNEVGSVDWFSSGLHLNINNVMGMSDEIGVEIGDIDKVDWFGSGLSVPIRNVIEIKNLPEFEFGNVNKIL